MGERNKDPLGKEGIRKLLVRGKKEGEGMDRN